MKGKNVITSLKQTNYYNQNNLIGLHSQSNKPNCLSGQIKEFREFRVCF